MLAREVAISAGKLASHGDRTLAREIANHCGDRVLGRYLNTHGPMIRHHMAFDDATGLLSGQRVKDRPQRLAHVPKQGCASPFRDKHHRILYRLNNMGHI